MKRSKDKKWGEEMKSVMKGWRGRQKIKGSTMASNSLVLEFLKSDENFAIGKILQVTTNKQTHVRRQEQTS